MNIKKILVPLVAAIVFFNFLFASPEKAYEYEEKANLYLVQENYELAADYFLKSIVEYNDNHDLKEFLKRFGVDVDKLDMKRIEEIQKIQETLSEKFKNTEFVTA